MFYNARNKKVKIGNTDAYYVTFGKGSKNLIIIPGLGDGFKTVKGLAIPFAFMYKIFCDDYKVYIFSRRNNLLKGTTTEDMADDIICHMNELRIDKADVIGISEGGMIAEYLAINAKDRINKLVLAVTVARPNDILINSINTWVNMAKNKDYKGIMSDTLEKSYTGSYLKRQRFFSKIIGLFGYHSSYDRFIIEAEACLSHRPSDIESITAKTLVIGAKNDKVVGSIGSVELADRIKNSKLYLYEEYSHGVYEQDKLFNKRIFDFLNEE